MKLPHSGAVVSSAESTYPPPAMMSKYSPFFPPPLAKQSQRKED